MAPKAPPSDLFAAIDLGSNSFHLVVGRLARGDLRLVTRQREQVQLAAGLGRDGRLSNDAVRRALDCLGRFGQLVEPLPSSHVRAVGTNTLRVAGNAGRFLEKARQALGHPIEIVSGREEARLIWVGVATAHGRARRRRLVVDIGGGSTEIVAGRGLEPEEAESLYMGCVSWTRRFFPDGKITASAFERAETAARAELRAVARRLRDHGWDEAVGASGTIVSVRDTLAELGLGETITPRGLRELRRWLVSLRHVRRIGLEWIRRDRGPILPAGLAVLEAIFAELSVKEMEVSSGALREGVLHDLVGRVRHADVRDAGLARFAERFGVDRSQARRVAESAEALFAQVADVWGFDPEEDRAALLRAAKVHEVGLAVSHSGHHRHGGYLVENADLPGFSREEQRLLAALVRTQRRRFVPEAFDAVEAERRQGALRLAILLRLAVLLHRGRSTKPLPAPALRVDGRRLTLVTPRGWLTKNRLTAGDLEAEQAELSGVGVRFRFR